MLIFPNLMWSCSWMIPKSVWQSVGVGKSVEIEGAFLVDVNDWDSESRECLRGLGSDGTTAACSSGGATREPMSNESRLLDLLAAARDSHGGLQKRTIAKCVRQYTCGTLGVVGHCEEFDPVLVRRAKMEEKDFVDKMGVCDVVPWSDAAKKRCRVIRTRCVMENKRSDDNPQIRARWVAHEFRARCGDKHEYFSETPDLALVKAVTAHAARWAERGDSVVAVFDVRRVYFYAEGNRDTFVELPDYMPRTFAPGGSWRTRDWTMNLRYVQGGCTRVSRPRKCLTWPWSTL